MSGIRIVHLQIFAPFISQPNNLRDLKNYIQHRTKNQENKTITSEFVSQVELVFNVSNVIINEQEE